MGRLLHRERRAALRRQVSALLLVAGTSIATERVEMPAGAREPMRVSALTKGAADGRPVILVHGTPGSAAGWEDMLAGGDEALRWIAVDRPGFGETEPTDAETRLERQSAALEPFLPPAGSPGAILLGHSLGGAVVADAAARYPDRVAGIVIAAGALDPDLEHVYWIQHVGDWSAVAWILPRSLRNANRELIGFEAELRSLAPRLTDVRCPVIVVHGTEDALVPYANVAYMEENLGHTRLNVLTLEDAGHFLPWEYTEVLHEAIGSLLPE